MRHLIRGVALLLLLGHVVEGGSTVAVFPAGSATPYPAGRVGMRVIEGLRVSVTTKQYDSSVAAPVYRPFGAVSFLSKGTYSKTLIIYQLPSRLKIMS